MSNEDAQQLQGSALGRGSFSPRSCERYLLKSLCEQRVPRCSRVSRELGTWQCWASASLQPGLLCFVAFRTSTMGIKSLM